jgi:hypothetical protein
MRSISGCVRSATPASRIPRPTDIGARRRKDNIGPCTCGAFCCAFREAITMFWAVLIVVAIVVYAIVVGSVRDHGPRY